MSFDWNLSSDEEDLKDFLATRSIDTDSQIATCAVATAASATDTNLRPLLLKEINNNFDDVYDDNDDDGDDDDDNVIWEDATTTSVGHNTEDDADIKPAATVSANDKSQAPRLQLKVVQLDLNNSTKASVEKGKAKEKRRRKPSFRASSLPLFLQTLLNDLQRTHLLALTSRSLFISRICTNHDILAVALSLVPPQWALLPVTDPAITMSELHKFMNWFIPWVHNVDERRRSRRRANQAAGAPLSRLRPRKAIIKRIENDNKINKKMTTHLVEEIMHVASYLSPTHDDNPQLQDEQFDSIHCRKPVLVRILLLAMMRSLGWRARYVQAMEPISTRLDEEHPLLVTVMNHLLQVSNMVRQTSNASTKSQRILFSGEKNKDHKESTLISTNGTCPVIGWIEILVSCDDTNIKSNRRSNNKESQYHWVHVDPVRKLINAPEQVESSLPKEWSTNGKSRSVLAYAVAVEHYTLYDRNSEGLGVAETTITRLTDVTPRYSSSWIASLQKRGLLRSKKQSVLDTDRQSWWSQSLRAINQHYGNILSRKRSSTSPPSSFSDLSKRGRHAMEAIAVDIDVDDEEGDTVTENKEIETQDPFEQLAAIERRELEESAHDNETIPTSKSAFQTHPLYVIKSSLGKAEVLAPDASKRICGVFKGQLVYRRADVSTALTALKWKYEGREVRPDELSKPVKVVQSRKKSISKKFQALRSYGVGTSNDGSEEQRATDIARASESLDDAYEDTLYGFWQTDPWSPAPVGPTDVIPVNEYRNIELALLNPGLVHMEYPPGLAGVAKRLGIPYAPCLVGFEGHGGNRAPSIRGIVVHEHNELILREAGAESQLHAAQQEHEHHRRAVLLRWKRLMVGLLTKDRLDREYGGDDFEKKA